MSEVATIAGQSGVKAGAGAAKAGGANAGAMSVLDGAFAAMLGKAGDGDAPDSGSSFAALLTADDKDAAAALGPVEVQVDPSQTSEADQPVGICVVDIGGFGPLGDTMGKPGRAKPRGVADEASPIAIAANLPAALISPAADPVATTAVASDGKDQAGVEGVGTIDGLQAGHQLADTGIAPEIEAEASLERAAAAPVFAQVQGNQPQNSQSASPAAVLAAADGAAQNGTQNGESEGESGHGRSPARDPQVSSAAAQPVDFGAAGPDSALRSIMQALPPVLQSQLSVGVASGAAPAAASAGELLGNQVIDMSVKGQWIDRMAREIASLAEGTGHSRFQLSPPNLGKIHVDLWRNEDSMNLRLVTETDEAARRLNEGKSALEAHARVASLALGHVSVEKASASDSARDQGQNPQQHRQGAEQSGGHGQQQANAQAHGQSAQGRGNGRVNRDGNSVVIAQDQAGEADQPARTARANDPRVRFA